MIIGIIGAMEKEIKKYQELFSFQFIDKNFSIYEANDQNKKILLCQCGIGKVNAAILTEYLIEHYHVDMIINSGCCGSLTEKGKVLDTIIIDYATYHDFSPTRIMEECVPDQGKIKTDPKLTILAENICKEHNISYRIGGIASGDCFVTDYKIRDQIASKTQCIAVDMESASIAHVAKLNQVPFMIIRTISDFADGIDEQEEQAANISAQIVKEIISKIKY